MTPRTSVQTIQADEQAAVVLEALQSGHARFPVIGRDIDDIVGVIGLHDLLEVDPEARRTTLVRDLADEAYGSRGFTVRDPEGNLFSLGTYAGEDPR